MSTMLATTAPPMLILTTTVIDHTSEMNAFNVTKPDCQDASQSTLQQIEDRINVVVPYLVVLGIIGNILSILTFSQRKLRILSCGCYLLLLAIFDTMALLIMSRPYFFKQFGLVHHLNSSFLCGLHFFLTKIFDELTPWLLVFVAGNRLFLSRYPRKGQCFQTAHAAIWSAFVLLLIIILINAHLLFGIRVGYSSVDHCSMACGPSSASETYLFFYLNISPIIDLSLSMVIPFCIVFIANIFILANVRRVKKQVLRTRRRRRAASRNARLSIVLLADLITFLVVSLPVLLVECIYRFTRGIENRETMDYYIQIGWIIANKILYLNYSLSFYFYVLTSSYFRHHFLLAIRCKKLHGFLFEANQKQRLTQPKTHLTSIPKASVVNGTLADNLPKTLSVTSNIHLGIDGKHECLPVSNEDWEQISVDRESSFI